MKDKTPEEIGIEYISKWYLVTERDVAIKGIKLALKAERERIKKILRATKVCECIDINKCVICKAIDEVK